MNKNISDEVQKIGHSQNQLFFRPHKSASDGCVEISVNFEVFRTIEAYEEWEKRISQEIEEVYQEKVKQICCVTYSTVENPKTFGSEVNPRLFHMVKAYDEARRMVGVLQVELEESIAQSNATDAQRDPEKKMNRKERKQQKEEKMHIKDVKKRLDQANYDIVCLEQKLVNVFKMSQIRVVYVQE